MHAVATTLVYPAHTFDATQKKTLALKALQKQTAITQLASEYKISRKFIYQQQMKAISAIDNAFMAGGEEEEKILFHLPVTKSWIQQFVLSLALDCRACFRGIIKALNNLLDYKLSIGSVFNIIKTATIKAKIINAQQDLSQVTLGANDELFHHNQPVLTGVDINSLYCYLLAQEQHRDQATWAIHLWDLEKQGFKPARIMADDGDGLRAGHQLALPHVPCDGDHFHLIKTLQELRQFFANRLKSTLTYQRTLEQKMEKAKLKQNSQKYSRRLGIAKKQTRQLQQLYQTLNILISWMEHDVLNKPGAPLSIRQELYDFIVTELKKLEVLHPHRLRTVRITLQNQRDSLLAFTEVLHEKFKLIAEQFHYPMEKIWELCELQRCEHSSDQYGFRSLPLQDYFKANFDAVEDAVIQALDSTERTSSMVENLNSRLSSYFFLRREIGHDYLELLRFYFNHTPFLRSENPKRVNKTPAELLTGKPHSHWLEMLGFQRFKRAA